MYELRRSILSLCILYTLSFSFTLDVSSLDTKTTIKLIGPWTLFKDTLIAPLDAVSQHTDDSLRLPGYITVPEKGALFNGYGAHTLQLKLRGLLKDSCYAMHIPEVFSAYNLYLDDSLIAHNGVVGTSKATTKAEWRTEIAHFKAADTTALLTYHISNYQYKWNGFMLTPFIGTRKGVDNKHKSLLAVDLILFGAIGIFALYHILLFFLYRHDKTPLYFGIISILFAVRTLITGELLLTHFWKGVPWELLVKLNFIGIGLFIPLFGRYLQSLFPNHYLEKAMKPADVLSMIYCLVVLFTPAAFHSHLLSPAYHLVLLYGCICMVISIVKALKAKAPFANYPFWAMVILTVAIINDVLSSQNVLATPQVTPVGLITFVFLQAFLISKKFSKAFHKSELLGRKLRALNSELEARVAERTKDLSERNSELEIALAEVKTLSGLLPICANCKKIKDDNGYWERIEEYFEEHADIDFSHGLCPDCATELYPDLVIDVDSPE